MRCPAMSRRRRPRSIPAYTDLLLTRSGWSMLFCAGCIVLLVGCIVADVVEDRDSEGAFQFLVIVGILGILASGSNAVLWYRCHRSVRSTGWREGTATITAEVAGTGEHRHREVTVDVDHLDGTFTRLSMWSLSRVAGLRGTPELRVLVGGRGTTSVLVIPGLGQPLVSRAHGWSSLAR